MPKFSQRSRSKLNEAHPDLQRLFNEVIEQFDCAIICGYRGEEEQEEAYLAGTSKARWGESPHNFSPSYAVDVVPYPLNWKNIKCFQELGEVVKQVAKRLNIEIRWGGDFKSFKDYPHFELAEFKNLHK